MMLRRLLVLLAVIGLTLAGLDIAWAHPGHAPMTASAHDTPAVHAESLAPSKANPPAPCTLDSRPASRHHVPPAVALVAGALTMLAALPHRRRTLAFALALLLATVASEGMFHAALHLRHVPHADGLTIGAAPIPPAVQGPEGAEPVAPVFARLTEGPRHYDASLPDITVGVKQGRAPPLSPA